MKIAIVVPIVGNFGRKGFYHSQEIGLGETLAGRGHEVTVYKCVPRGSIKQIEAERHGAVTVKYLPTRSIGPHGLMDVRAVDPDADVVFAFSDTQLIIPKLFRYCKKNGMLFIPYVGIAHSFQRNFKSKIMDLIFRFTTLRVYRRCAVVTKTVDARQELEALGVNRCVVAPVGLDFTALKADYAQCDRDELRRKWGFGADDVIVSFVARLQPEKHPLELLDIFKRVSRANKKLLIVGKGPLEDDLKARAAALGIADRVRFVREVPYEAMWEIHYISDYFVNLRPEEIFGMAIMEAVYYLSCVAAIRAPGPNTILADMKGHYLCDTYDDVVRAIDCADTDAEDLRRAKAHLEEAFTWRSCCDAIMKIAAESGGVH